VLRLNDQDGSLRCSLSGILGRAYERVFYGPNVLFVWTEVRLAENVERFAVFQEVRFEIVQEDGPKWSILSGNEGPSRRCGR
jgi:hypothetical protein